jgi:hypothetical protein
MGEIIHTEKGIYISPAPGEVISSQGEVLDLVSLCGEARSDKLLIPGGSLVEKFFDLSSGLAGEICIKLSTYRIKTAIVVDLDSISSQRFKEWAGECNRGSEIAFRSSRDQAVDWLLG